MQHFFTCHEYGVKKVQNCFLHFKSWHFSCDFCCIEFSLDVYKSCIKLLYLNYFKLLSTAFMLNIPWTSHLFSAATVNFENYLMFFIFILLFIMTCVTLLCAGEALTQSDLDKLKKLEIHRILKCLQNEVCSEEVLS